MNHLSTSQEVRSVGVSPWLHRLRTAWAGRMPHVCPSAESVLTTAGSTCLSRDNINILVYGVQQ